MRKLLCLLGLGGIFGLFLVLAVVSLADIGLGASTMIRMSWVPPNTRVTGEAMDDSEIGHYDVHCWPAGEPQDSRFLGSVENTGNTNSALMKDHILKFVGTCTLAGCDFFPRVFVPGLNECAVSAVDVEGVASDFSNSVLFSIPPWSDNPFGLAD